MGENEGCSLDSKYSYRTDHNMPATIMPVTESDAIAVSGRYEYGDSVPPGVPTKPEGRGLSTTSAARLGFMTTSSWAMEPSSIGMKERRVGVGAHVGVDWTG